MLMPLVAAAKVPQELIDRLRAALVGAAQRSWFAPYAELLQLEGFSAATLEDYSGMLDWEREARAAGYEIPA